MARSCALCMVGAREAVHCILVSLELRAGVLWVLGVVNFCCDGQNTLKICRMGFSLTVRSVYFRQFGSVGPETRPSFVSCHWLYVW